MNADPMKRSEKKHYLDSTTKDKLMIKPTLSKYDFNNAVTLMVVAYGLTDSSL